MEKKKKRTKTKIKKARWRLRKPKLASIDLLQFDVCGGIGGGETGKHFRMGLKKGNTEHYVGLINNQITDFYQHVINMYTSSFFEVLLCPGTA